MEAVKKEDLPLAETEIESALRHSQRPEYYFLLANLVHSQGRLQEAIGFINNAIALDPFGYELMEKKFYLLQEADQMQDAIHWYSHRGWKADAMSAARRFGDSILARAREGRSMREAVDSVRQLSAVHRDQPEGRRHLAILQDIIRFSPEAVADQLRDILNCDELLDRYQGISSVASRTSGLASLLLFGSLSRSNACATKAADGNRRGP